MRSLQTQLSKTLEEYRKECLKIAECKNFGRANNKR